MPKRWLMAGAAALATLAAGAPPPAPTTAGTDPQADCRRMLTGPRSDTEAQRRCAVAVYRGPSADWPRPHVDAGVAWQELAPRTPLPAQPAAQVALGEQLFFDRRLSRDGDVSCASCHQPNLGFADARKLALGQGGAAGTRHTPSLFGVAFVPQLMWDGRAANLEAQALLPIANPVEMAMDLDVLQKRLASETDYTSRFDAAFGPGGVTLRRLGEALAAFERRIEAPRTRFDEFIEGRRDALTPQEVNGLHLFRTQARCMNCHSGPQLTQHEFHQIGVSFIGRRQEDKGRQIITRRDDDLGAMRVPSLRGVSRTAPYFHQGFVPTLHGVLQLYNAGMPQPQGRNGVEIPPASPLIQPLQLTLQELRDLEAFLNTL